MSSSTVQKAWRPVQFLGNKLRVLDEVTDAVLRGLDDGSVVWDAFSGSSVVSQSFAARGMRVIATDKLKCSVTFARAMLSVDRVSSSGLSRLRGLAAVNAGREYAPWDRYLRSEDDAIDRRSAQDLASLARAVPLRWRAAGAEAALTRKFAQVEAAARTGTQHPMASVLSTYAGTYFGIRQSLDMDVIATGILDLAARGEIDAWERDAGLTALASAASSAVFSAGKHFAQPINVTHDVSKFHAGRLLVDRSVSVRESYLRSLDFIEQGTHDSGGHLAFETEAENVSSDYLSSLGVAAVYADPPYTAQQYSRFYHLLDTVIAGVPALLQRSGSGGAVTKGLYPEERFKSAFCSRRRAPEAFERLARQTYDASARLVISYSVSAPGSTGNSRSIGLDQLLSVLGQVYGEHRVEVREMDIRYRQFNQSRSAFAAREDPEVLIVAEAR